MFVFVLALDIFLTFANCQINEDNQYTSETNSQDLTASGISQNAYSHTKQQTFFNANGYNKEMYRSSEANEEQKSPRYTQLVFPNKASIFISISPIWTADGNTISNPIGRYGRQRASEYAGKAEANPAIGGVPVPTLISSRSPITSKDALKTEEGNLEISTKSGFPQHKGGKSSEPQVSWQVSVFSKEVSPYVRVCGGSLVTRSAVISVASCFWAVSALPADQFVVGAKKVFFGNKDYYTYQHHKEVRTIRIPPRFRSAATSYQEDIAVLLTEPFYLHEDLKPICVNFKALEEEKDEGTVLGNTCVKGYPGMSLRNHEVIFIDVEECLRLLPEEDLKYITGDKFCAGIRYGPYRGDYPCQPDPGSGLATFESELIPYLRGVACARPSNGFGTRRITTYTDLRTHRTFLLQHIQRLEEACFEHYPQRYTTAAATGDASERDGEFVCNCYC